MKFRIDAAVLRKHLDLVKPPRSKQIPILQAVHIVACETDGRVTLSQHNGARYIRTSLTSVRHPLHPSACGQVVVDWFELYESLRGQKGTVSLEETFIHSEDGSIKDQKRLDVAIELASARVRLSLYNPEDLPCPFCPSAERQQYSLTARAGKLIDVMARALPVAAQDDPRPQVRGIHVRASEGAGVRIAATDSSYRVFAEDFGSPERTGGDWEFVLPERFCKALLKAAELLKPSRDIPITLTADSWQQCHVDAREKEREAASEDELETLPELALGTGCVQATWGNVVIADPTPEGKFPAIERVTPVAGECGARALINRLKLVEVLRPHRPKPCDGGQCVYCVSLHFASRGLGVVFRPGTDGVPISSFLRSKEEDTEELSVAFLAHGLLLALQAVPDEWVHLYANAPRDPVLILGYSSRAVVSPVQPEHVCPIDHPDWETESSQERRQSGGQLRQLSE